jgi:hypothetical protein
MFLIVAYGRRLVHVGPLIVKSVQKKAKIFWLGSISASIHKGFMQFSKVSNFYNQRIKSCQRISNLFGKIIVAK